MAQWKKKEFKPRSQFISSIIYWLADIYYGVVGILKSLFKTIKMIARQIKFDIKEIREQRK
ncbi:MAG: hypothetical protein ACYSSO_12995 [Planctomycetota bacterium]|jgi:hypothetical protein